jgi:hypothetical protein
MSNKLTPYDTGARAEPKPWTPTRDEDYGKVDFTDDADEDVATVYVEHNPTTNGYTVHVYTERDVDVELSGSVTPPPAQPPTTEETNTQLVNSVTGEVVGEVKPGYHLVTEQFPRTSARIVRVTAQVEFEAYALTEGFHGGKSLEAQVAAEIADAIGYRAVHAVDTEDGDALIAMTTYPEFAVDVRHIEVAVQPRMVDLAHVVEQAVGTSGEW